MEDKVKRDEEDEEEEEAATAEDDEEDAAEEAGAAAAALLLEMAARLVAVAHLALVEAAADAVVNAADSLSLRFFASRAIAAADMEDDGAAAAVAVELEAVDADIDGEVAEPSSGSNLCFISFIFLSISIILFFASANWTVAVTAMKSAAAHLFTILPVSSSLPYSPLISIDAEQWEH